MKILNNGWIVVFIIAIGGITVQSCKKGHSLDDQDNSNILIDVPNCNAKIEDGILKFETYKDVIHYREYISKLSYEEINELEVRNGFQSYERKVNDLLIDYEKLNEDSSQTTQKIMSFRQKYSDYLTISDTDFNANIIGLDNRLINSDGYLIVDTFISRYIKNNIYTTSINNKQLLTLKKFKDKKVSITEIEKHEILSNQSNKVERHNPFYFTNNKKCGRWRKTKISLYFYTGGGYPAWGQVGYMTLYCGYAYSLKNLKRGWTGVWYGESRYSKNEGYHDASYRQFHRYNHTWSSSISPSYTYNHGFWQSSQIVGDPGTGIVWTLWKDSILNSIWSYMDGTVTYDLCGYKNVSY